MVEILITGASGAIGAALALEHAGPGVVLHLQGRDAARLTDVARKCRDRGAQVCEQVLDVRDHDALRQWLQGLGALDRVIINAGVNRHPDPGQLLESWEATETVLDVNLKAAMAVVHAVLPAMRVRRQGQIALVSSLAAWYGLPVMPAYSAAKAGLKNYAEALRGALAAEGIHVSVVLPGYVASPMSEAMPGPKPWVWTPQRAARRIRRGLDRQRARISFPFPLNWGCWWLSVLPPALSARILRWLGYGR